MYTYATCTYRGQRTLGSPFSLFTVCVLESSGSEPKAFKGLYLLTYPHGLFKSADIPTFPFDDSLNRDELVYNEYGLFGSLLKEENFLLKHPRKRTLTQNCPTLAIKGMQGSLPKPEQETYCERPCGGCNESMRNCSNNS